MRYETNMVPAEIKPSQVASAGEASASVALLAVLKSRPTPKVSPQRTQEHDHHQDDTPDSRAEAVVERVDHGSTGIAVETHYKKVVESEANEAEGTKKLSSDRLALHTFKTNSRSKPCNSRLPAEVVCGIGDISDPAILHAVPPENVRGVERGEADEERRKHATRHPKHLERVGKGEDGEDDVFGEKESRSLGPGELTFLDGDQVTGEIVFRRALVGFGIKTLDSCCPGQSAIDTMRLLLVPHTGLYAVVDIAGIASHRCGL